MFKMAVATEAVYRVVGRIIPFEPLLTKAEVYKVGCTHFMSMDYAGSLLGYTPIVPYAEAVKRTRAFHGPAVHSAAARARAQAMLVLVVVIAIAALIYLCS